MYKIPAFIVLASLAIALSACSFSLVSDITPPPGSEQQPPQPTTKSVGDSPVYPIVPPDLVDGAKIFNQECADCHGSQGLGDGPQASQLSVPVATLGLSDFARLYSPADWYAVVTQGNMERFMPAFANLTDRQRWDVVAYAMNLGAQDEQVAQGKTLYKKNCSVCHGQDGDGNGSNAVNLSTPPTDFTDQSVMATNSATKLYQAISAGVLPDMPAFEDKLDDNERWALVSYLRSLTYARPEISLNAYPAPEATSNNTTSTSAMPTLETYTSAVVTQSPVITPTAEISPTSPMTGIIAVQLINGSDGSTPSDVPVTLYGFDEMQMTYSETLTAGENGLYTFSDVAIPADRAFMAGTHFASGTYGSDIVTVDPATPDINLHITVYNTTTDTSALTTDRVHIIFDFTQPEIAQVIELFIISNPSKQSIISPNQDGTVVTFPLPEGYSNLQFQDGELGGRYVAVDRGFADTAPVNPGVGSYTAVFTFQMPYDRKLVFAQPMSLPTSAVIVMVPDIGLKLDADEFQDGGILTYQGITYHKYSGSRLDAGSLLEFTLSGNPKSSETTLFSPGTMQSLATGLGAFGVALLIAGVWLYRRNQVRIASQGANEGMDLPSAGEELESAPDDEDTLMDAIIALDDQYNAGNLPEEAYLKRRSVLKDRLRNLKDG